MGADLLVRNAREVVTLAGGSTAPFRGAALRTVQTIDNGAVAVKNGRIAAVGPRAAIEAEWGDGSAILDAEGGTVVPGFVDPHTHLLFAGSRDDEFYRRVAGESYMEIARAGGGIARTVAATRAAAPDELIATTRRRLDLLLRQGTTTVEIKSGYGLSTASEIAQLKAVRALASERPDTIVATFLGAHALPPGFAGSRADYVASVIRDMLPAVAHGGLAAYCDVFCEAGAFTVDESRDILAAASALGLKAKVHADELSRSGGTALAAEIGAASADHLNFAAAADVESLRRAGTVAVLLPATPFFLLAPRYADGRALIDAGVAVALATDFNPTSSISAMPFVMFLACLHMKFDPSEALTAATINAAHAIGCAARVGSLEPGKQADLVVLDIESHRALPFQVGRDAVAAVVKCGHIAYRRAAQSGAAPA